MLLAAYRGKSEVIKVLQEFGSDVHATNEFGGTPMHIASTNGRVEVVQVLYGFGADVNALDNNGSTPMHSAAEKGRVEVIQVLHGFGCDINKANNVGATPLMVACLECRVAAVKALIGLGANISSKKGGATARGIAVEIGRTDIVSLFDEEMRLRLRIFLLGTLRHSQTHKTSSPVLMLNQNVLGMSSVIPRQG
eukprot:c19599_g4_i1.p1 GENE.c19599_g4_i1~~c19599_g4_i1.p1  ORF type:complete len:194 (-),score=40.70 c19599_g4_i1:36-617(-)